MSKRYYWLKLKEDFFRDKVMKKMRKIAGGDTYVVIYLKMMLMSIQTGGELYFEGIENDFADELALALDEDEENIRVALGFLMRSGKLIEKSKSVYFMPEASEAIGSESSSAERVRKFREKQKQEQLEAEVTVALPCTAETPELLQCNTGETLCNVTGNVEKSRVEKIRVDKRESTGAQSDKPTDTPSQSKTICETDFGRNQSLLSEQAEWCRCRTLLRLLRIQRLACGEISHERLESSRENVGAE